MKFKRNQMLLFILLFLLTFILRYPIITHELGTDSFVNHMTINLISDRGGPVWLVHPLQFTGIGEMLNMEMTISGISQLSGLDVEKSILYYCLIINVLGVMGFFILINLVTKDFITAFLSALLFSIAPDFIRLTTWTASSRSFLLVLLPLLLYFIFKNVDKFDFKNILLAVIFLIILMGSHNIITFVFIMIFAIFVTFILSKFNIIIPIKNKQLIYQTIFILLFLAILYSLFFKLGPYASSPSLWVKYSSGTFFTGEDAKTLFLNMTTNYIALIGLLLLIAYRGIIFLFRKSELTLFDKFCLIFILMMSPLLGVGIYVPIILLFPLLYLISTGLLEISRSSNESRHLINIGNNTLIILLITCAVIFSIFMNFHWEAWKIKSVDDIEYSKETGVFLKTYGNGTFIPNQRSMAYRWTAYSNVLFKPSGSYEENRDRYKAYIVFDKSSIKTGKLLQMLRYQKILTSTTKDQEKDSGDGISGEFWYAVTSIWSDKIEDNRLYFDKNRVKYTVETNIDPYSNSYISGMKFFVDVHANKGKIFDTGLEEMWYF